MLSEHENVTKSMVTVTSNSTFSYVQHVDFKPAFLGPLGLILSYAHRGIT